MHVITRTKKGYEINIIKNGALKPRPFYYKAERPHLKTLIPTTRAKTAAAIAAVSVAAAVIVANASVMFNTPKVKLN